MSKMMFSKFIFICNFVFFTAILSAEPPKDILQQNAIAVYPEYFSIEDDFIILGEIEIDENNIIFLVHNCHFWGNGRMTGRILLFNSNYQLIGMYSSISGTPKIEGKKLIFPFPERIGNTVDFSNGIPLRIWIDGHIYNYEIINLSGNPIQKNEEEDND